MDENSDKKIKYYQASSSEMYGIEIDKPLTESHSFSPKSPYAKAKLANHKKVLELSESYDWKIFSGIMFNLGIAWTA